MKKRMVIASLLLLNVTLGLLAFRDAIRGDLSRVHADDLNPNLLFHDRSNNVQIYKVRDGNCILYVGFGYGVSSSPTPITIAVGPGCK